MHSLRAPQEHDTVAQGQEMALLTASTSPNRSNVSPRQFVRYSQAHFAVRAARRATGGARPALTRGCMGDYNIQCPPQAVQLLRARPSSPAGSALHNEDDRHRRAASATGDQGTPCSEHLVEGTGDDLLLLGACELVEVHGVPRHADGQVRVALGVVHRIHERRAVQDVDIDVLRGREWVREISATRAPWDFLRGSGASPA